LNKTISEEIARNVYLVVFDSDTLLLDEEATISARAAERENRRERGRPYHEFLVEWSLRRPPAEILTYFGEWPTARKNREVVRI
jgi:acetophenone carboxylase